MLWLVFVGLIRIALATCAGWVGVEYKPEDLNVSSNLVAGTISALAMVLLQTKWPAVWEKIKSLKPGAPLVFAVMAAAMFLCGCQLTARQFTVANEVAWKGYNATAGYMALTGRLVEPEETNARKDLEAWDVRLDDAWVWLHENPDKAHIPGLRPPSLNEIEMLQSALNRRGVFLTRLTSFGLVSRTRPPLAAPTTRPH